MIHAEDLFESGVIMRASHIHEAQGRKVLLAFCATNCAGATLMGDFWCCLYSQL